MARRWKRRICRAARCFRRVAPWLAAALGLVAVAVLIYVQLRNQDGRADTTTLGLLLIGVVLLFIIAAPTQAVEAADRITKLKLGALEVGLKEIKRADRVSTVPAEDDDVQTIRPPNFGYRKIVEKLKGRLRLVSEILEFERTVKRSTKKDEDVDDDDRYDYRKIAAWLRKRDLLNQEEEAFVLDLLDGTGADVRGWDSQIRKEFLDAAYAFSARFGPKMWDRWVRQKLAADGWFLTDFRQGKGHRADFLAFREGKWALMTARVGGTGSNYVEKAAPRLMKFDRFKPIKSRVIVIPKIRRGVVDERYEWSPDRPGGVKVINLGDLKKDPKLPFAGPTRRRSPRDR